MLREGVTTIRNQYVLNKHQRSYIHKTCIGNGMNKISLWNFKDVYFRNGQLLKVRINEGNRENE